MPMTAPQRVCPHVYTCTPLYQNCNLDVYLVLESVCFANHRPTEVELLIGSPAKAKKALGWTPCMTFTGIRARN